LVIAYDKTPFQPTRSFGYPQESPPGNFNGRALMTVEAPEWYEVDFIAGGQKSKCMGNDLTGGSSGGAWILGWNNQGGGFNDTDGFSSTDPPGGPSSGWNLLNGVNSHKRCRIDCRPIPTNTNGVYWQEMCSPPFLSGDANSARGIFEFCFRNGGS
jgi:hypothetical protein